MARILNLQPFYGGSHRMFIDGWINHSTHQWTSITLPARHWKWRMRHSAVYMSERANDLFRQQERWDVIFTTDMLNVAEFKGLLMPVLRKLPIVVYFHENQFAYPTADNTSQERDMHFAFTNLTSALAATRAWFNSKFNLDSLLDGARSMMKRWPDFAPQEALTQIGLKSEIRPPGIELGQTPRPRFRPPGPMRLVWAARWEHDKNPDDLYLILSGLRNQGIDFNISVIGQSYTRVPAVFERIQAEFANEILHWGWVDSRSEYLRILADSDVFLSTARHEFFGLSVAEAIGLGTYPMLPDRLAYPELVACSQHPEKYLYNGDVTDAVERLGELATQIDAGGLSVDSSIHHRFGVELAWPSNATGMDRELTEVSKLGPSGEN